MVGFGFGVVCFLDIISEPVYVSCSYGRLDHGHVKVTCNL